MMKSWVQRAVLAAALVGAGALVSCEEMMMVNQPPPQVRTSRYRCSRVGCDQSRDVPVTEASPKCACGASMVSDDTGSTVSPSKPRGK